MHSSWSRSIRFRFLLAISAMLLPLAVLGVTSYLSINRVIDSVYSVIEDPYRELELTSRTEVALLNALMAPNDYLVHGEHIERNNFERLSAEVEKAFDDLTHGVSEGHTNNMDMAAARRDWDQGKRMAIDLLSIERPVGNRAAAAAMERMDLHFEKILNYLRAIKRSAREEANEQLMAAEQVKRQSIIESVAVFIVGLIISVVAALLLMRSIVGPIQNLHTTMQRFGRGQLTQRVEMNRDDELGRLAEAFNDMASQVQSITEKLTDESMHDSLTGILNRRELERQLQRLIEHAARHKRTLALAMLDLDHFKYVNDEHGHQTGDELLRKVARVMENNLRPGDVLARYGGEEFIAVLPEAEIDGARRVAERIRLLVSGTKAKRDGKDISTTISIGLAVFPVDGRTAKELMAAADRALYGAKASGRNQVQAAQSV